MRYNFDEIVDRSGNHAAKYDERKKKFGTDDVIPLWIADMDFRTAQPIIDALTARAQEGIWGYTARPESYFAAIRDWQKRRNGWEIDPSLMSFSLGVVQSISAMVKLFTPEGGNVLIQTPVYSQFYDMAEAWNRNVLKLLSWTALLLLFVHFSQTHAPCSPFRNPYAPFSPGGRQKCHYDRRQSR